MTDRQIRPHKLTPIGFGVKPLIVNVFGRIWIFQNRPFTFSEKVTSVSCLTVVSAPEIKEAYDDIRNDSTDTDWLLITFAEGSNNKRFVLVGQGSGGLEELKSNIGADFIGFAYLRVPYNGWSNTAKGVNKSRKGQLYKVTSIRYDWD